MDSPPPSPVADRTQSTLLVCIAVLLLAGFGLQLLLWSRQWLYGDQYALLLSAIRYLDSGELAPFTKEMSGGGRIVGGLRQILNAWPLSLWADFRAPALAMGLTQVGAVAVLMAVLSAAYDRRFVVFFLAAYWLSPWRLYHAGALWEPGFLFLPAALHMAAAWLLRAPPDGNRLEVNGNVRQAAHGTAPAIGASLLLGVALVATPQLHAAFVVPVVATALLGWRGLIRCNFFGFVAGRRAVGDAGCLGQTVGGRAAVPAAADDDHLIGRLGLRAAPGFRPVLVVIERVAEQAEDRVARHHVTGAPLV